MKSMYSMVSLGFGEILGSLVIGYIIDKYGNKPTSYICMSLVALQTVIVMLYMKMDTYGVLAFVMTFVWGLQDSVVST
jgi:MFS family permease